MIKKLFNTQGLNLYVNPFLQNEGELVRAVNVDATPYGAIRKRLGYEAYLGTANGGEIRNLFMVDLSNNSSAETLYRLSGSVLYYKQLFTGTADWSVCGNGTFTGNQVGYAVLENTLIMGDGVGSTRHSTNGTSFTNTTGAPIAKYFEQFQQRIYAGGTADTLFFSTTGTPTDWSGVSPSDSSSIQIPGEGEIVGITKINDNLKIFKRGGGMFNWDGDYLTDMATKAGLNYDQSIGKIEDYAIWANDDGLYGSGGGRPELISNSVEPYFKTSNGFGFDIPGIGHKLDYYLSLQDNITEDILNNTEKSPVLKYNIQKDQFFLWSFPSLGSEGPSAFASYLDTNDVVYNNMIFGAENGQVYRMFKSTSGNNLYSDAGDPIASVIEMFIHLGTPESAKQWYEITLFFNPGSKAKVQIGTSNTFSRDNLKLTDLGDTSTGFVEYRFPQGTESHLLFLRIYESSVSPSWIYYGCAIDADVKDRR